MADDIDWEQYRVDKNSDNDVDWEQFAVKPSEGEDNGFFGTTRNIAAGFLQGLKSSAQPLAAVANPTNEPVNLFGFAQQKPFDYKTPWQTAPDTNKDYVSALLGRNIDPYAAMGTTPADTIFSRKGAEQAIGEWGLPALSATKYIAKGVKSIPDLIDIFRPGNTAKKMVAENMQDMQKDYWGNVAQQQKSYNLAMDRYGDKPVTNDPENYLNLSKTQKKALGPDAKSKLNDFNENPTLKNLHELQSQIGGDASRLNPTSRTYKIQSLNQIRSDLTNKVEDFLKNTGDQEAYYNYEHGKNLTRDQVKPYESNKTLKGIVQKNIQPENLQLDELQKALIKASEKGKNIIDPETMEITKQVGGIPKDHFLNELMNRMQEQQDIIGRRQIAQKALLGGTPLIAIEEMLRRYLSK